MSNKLSNVPIVFPGIARPACWDYVENGVCAAAAQGDHMVFGDVRGGQFRIAIGTTSFEVPQHAFPLGDRVGAHRPEAAGSCPLIEERHLRFVRSAPGIPVRFNPVSVLGVIRTLASKAAVGMAYFSQFTFSVGMFCLPSRLRRSSPFWMPGPALASHLRRAWLAVAAAPRLIRPHVYAAPVAEGGAPAAVWPGRHAGLDALAVGLLRSLHLLCVGRNVRGGTGSPTRQAVPSCGWGVGLHRVLASAASFRHAYRLYTWKVGSQAA